MMAAKWRLQVQLRQHETDTLEAVPLIEHWVGKDVVCVQWRFLPYMLDEWPRFKCVCFICQQRYLQIATRNHSKSR